MKTDNQFDEKVRLLSGRIPPELVDSARFVTNTIELGWASAQAVFGDKATPAMALAIYDRIVGLISNVEPEREVGSRLGIRIMPSAIELARVNSDTDAAVEDPAGEPPGRKE